MLLLYCIVLLPNVTQLCLSAICNFLPLLSTHFSLSLCCSCLVKIYIPICNYYYYYNTLTTAKYNSCLFFFSYIISVCVFQCLNNARQAKLDIPGLYSVGMHFLIPSLYILNTLYYYILRLFIEALQCHQMPRCTQFLAKNPKYSAQQ